ncbi:MAG: phenylalanine--tRNA ligase subunit beta [Ignavibacteriaceae bacterium]|nr:phenylalanine--tRNA ligase subunit beta [Ignavibacteriaceae bacterium]
MVISLNWLKEYISLEGISAEVISEKLTSAGLEVEKMTDQSAIYKGFVAAHVRECIKHPNADKLSLCKVWDGQNELSVVCGAPNVAVGQKVVLATIGTNIPGKDFIIKKSKIRGAESEGMLCSESELAISDNHEGIMVLGESAEPGSAISDLLGLNDVIFEIGITPNRPDALSHLGVARDLAAIFGREVKKPALKNLPASGDIHKLAAVEIADTQGCPRYTAKVVKNVTIGPSPEWLKNKIQSIGLRSINNVVDVTNFILHELGQPLHAFDLDTLAGNKIVVDKAGALKEFTTLDSNKRQMNPDILMINDGEKGIAIAGIMGGENSEVTAKTKNILLESAYFNPSVIRKGAKFLQMSSDASYRFERGTDPHMTPFAAERAAELIAEVAGGALIAGTIDIYPEKIEKKTTELPYSRIERILGFTIPKEKVIQILKSLEFVITDSTEEKLMLEIPTFRPDVEREIDVIEEVVRIFGYENIPDNLIVSYPVHNRVDQTEFDDQIKTALTGLGYFEAISLPMISEWESSLFGNPVKVKNPLTVEMEYLRTSLIPGMLQNIRRNIHAGEKTIRLFEIGNVMSRTGEGEVSWKNLHEETRCVLVLTGEAETKEWYRDDRKYDIFDLKGDLESLAAKFSIDSFTIDSYYSTEKNIFGSVTELKSRGQAIINGGSVRKDILRKFDIDQPVFCAEFTISSLAEAVKKREGFRHLPKFPKVFRDFAFILDSEVQFNELVAFVEKNQTPLLSSFRLFDVYEHKSLGEGKKSMAFSLEFYNENATLTDEIVDREFNSLIQKISKKFNAQLRGSN